MTRTDFCVVLQLILLLLLYIDLDVMQVQHVPKRFKFASCLIRCTKLSHVEVLEMCLIPRLSKTVSVWQFSTLILSIPLRSVTVQSALRRRRGLLNGTDWIIVSVQSVWVDKPENVEREIDGAINKLGCRTQNDVTCDIIARVWPGVLHFRTPVFVLVNNRTVFILSYDFDEKSMVE